MCRLALRPASRRSDHDASPACPPLDRLRGDSGRLRRPRPGAAGVLRQRGRDGWGDAPRHAPRGDRRSRPLPVHVGIHGHVGHPRARRRGPGALLQHPRRLQERELRQGGRRELVLQPRALLAEVVRLPLGRQHQLPLHGLPRALPLRLWLQLLPEQQAVRDLLFELHREAHRPQREPGRRQRHLSREQQLDLGFRVHRDLGGLGRPARGHRAGAVLHGRALRRGHPRWDGGQ